MEAVMSKSAFGDRVRARRAELGLTLAELAEKAGMHLQAVARIEAGRRPNPTWETVQSLARALNVPTDYFRDADEPADEQPEATSRPMGKRK